MVSVYEYYHTLESRIGYRLVLGGTRHFGYYPEGQRWPFPIHKALRAMEETLYQTMGLKEGATVLDGGTGTGDVAIYMAGKGLRVKAIDLLDLHVAWAKQNVKSRKAEGQVELYKMNYEDLSFEDGVFDGAYTLETLVHADDPDRAMREFYRVLKPGGVITHFEYEHDMMSDPGASSTFARTNGYAAMPAFQQFSLGTIRRKLEKVGFEDVEVKDLSWNILPMLRLFFILAYIPYILISLLGLEARFANTMAAVEFYRFRSSIKYLAVKARKPVEAPDDWSRSKLDPSRVDELRRR